MLEYREQKKAEYESLRNIFYNRMGLANQNRFEDYLREGLIRYPIVNHQVQGCILARTSVATKIKVLKRLIEEHCPGED